MKIKPIPNYVLNSDICIQMKMSNDRNKTLYCEATKILTLVHCDLPNPFRVKIIAVREICYFS